MQLDTYTLQVETEFFSPQLLERTTVFENDVLSVELNDVSLRHFHLIRGKHTAQYDNKFPIQFDNSFYVSHFVLDNTFGAKKLPRIESAINTYSTFYQDKAHSEIGIMEAEQKYEFFELAIQQSFLEQLINEDSLYADQLFSTLSQKDYNIAPKRTIHPSMLQSINDIKSSIFTGSLQQLYLETKAAELFLLQVKALKNSPSIHTKLRSGDIECLQEARLYVEKNYQMPCSIIDLAKIVGINQTKLKSGFKELFGTTVFGYVRDLQMEKAWQLLLDEKLYVNEVAEQIGYKHAQHFAAAFKRKFGILPSELK